MRLQSVDRVRQWGKGDIHRASSIEDALSLTLPHLFTSDENRRYISPIPMDTELARTFLVVIATGSFVEAAQRLHVTQSTVSTRIQRLEETLGAELFVRNKSGTTLTSAGQQFQRHAALLTRTVEQAARRSASSAAFARPSRSVAESACGKTCCCAGCRSSPRCARCGRARAGCLRGAADGSARSMAAPISA